MPKRSKRKESGEVNRHGQFRKLVYLCNKIVRERSKLGIGLSDIQEERVNREIQRDTECAGRVIFGLNKAGHNQRVSAILAEHGCEMLQQTTRTPWRPASK